MRTTAAECLAVRQATATKGFVYREGGESHTKPTGREQPCLYCSHLLGQICYYAGENLSFSPGLLFGVEHARREDQSSGDSPSLSAASLLHRSFCSRYNPAVTLAGHTPNTAPKLRQDTRRLKALRPSTVHGQRALHTWVSFFFRRTDQPRQSSELPSLPKLKRTIPLMVT